eukprot:342972_1
MDQFLVLSKSHKGSKIIDELVECIGNDISDHSSKAKWMMPNDNARTKMVKAFFYDFVIYESLLRPYRNTSTIMYPLHNQVNQPNTSHIIGYGLMVNKEINSKNSINDDENEYFVFIQRLFVILKYVLLSPLRIGFANCGAIILFYYHQYLYHKIIFKHLTQAIKQINQENNGHTDPFSFASNAIIQLDYLMIIRAYRRNKYGTQLVTHLMDQIYDDNEMNAPVIYVQCDPNSLLFYRDLGFKIVGLMDNVCYNRRYRSYSMLYHRNTNKLDSIVDKAKRLLQEENTLNIDAIGLSFDMSEDNDTSNLHFTWKFPLNLLNMNNMIELIKYLFKFGLISFIVKNIEQLMTRSTQISNYILFQWILKIICVLIGVACCLPWLIVVTVLRKFKIGAWD